MKPYLRLVVLLLSSAHFLLSAQVPSNLIGRWRSLETSKGGIGAMLEFHVDGSVNFSPGAVVELPYRIEGNQLILPSETNHGPEQKVAIQFVGENKLHLKPTGTGATPGNTTDLVRKGVRSDPVRPIIGEWTGPRDMGGHQLEQHWLFYPSGKSLLLIPFLTQDGRFTVNGATIRFEVARVALPEGHFEIDGDVLKLPGKKTESRYARY
jgi:hypothetical protein